MIYRALFAISFLLCACSSQKNYADRAYRFFRENPMQLASLCADKYPVRGDYRLGEEQIRTDTIVSEVAVLPRLENRFYKCPPNTKVVQRVRRVDTLFLENTARVAHLSAQLEQCKQKTFFAQELSKKLGWALAFVGLGFLSFVFIQFKRFI